MQKREMPFRENSYLILKMWARKNVYHLTLSKFQLKTGRKVLMLRRFVFCNSLLMGIK